MVQEGCDGVHVDIKNTKDYSILSSALDKVIFHLDSNSEDLSLFQVENLRIKDRIEPITGKDRQNEDGLELVNPFPFRVSKRVIVEEHHRFSTEVIRVHVDMVSVSMVRPVLL